MFSGPLTAHLWQFSSSYFFLLLFISSDLMTFVLLQLSQNWRKDAVRQREKGKADKLKQLDVAELQNVWLTFDADRSLTGLFFPSFARQPASQQSKGAQCEWMHEQANEWTNGKWALRNWKCFHSGDILGKTLDFLKNCAAERGQERRCLLFLTIIEFLWWSAPKKKPMRQLAVFVFVCLLHWSYGKWNCSFFLPPSVCRSLLFPSFWSIACQCLPGMFAN